MRGGLGAPRGGKGHDGGEEGALRKVGAGSWRKRCGKYGVRGGCGEGRQGRMRVDCGELRRGRMEIYKERR